MILFILQLLYILAIIRGGVEFAQMTGHPTVIFYQFSKIGRFPCIAGYVGMWWSYSADVVALLNYLTRHNSNTNRININKRPGLFHKALAISFCGLSIVITGMICISSGYFQWNNIESGLQLHICEVVIEQFLGYPCRDHNHNALPLPLTHGLIMTYIISLTLCNAIDMRVADDIVIGSVIELRRLFQKFNEIFGINTLIGLVGMLPDVTETLLHKIAENLNSMVKVKLQSSKLKGQIICYEIKNDQIGMSGRGFFAVNAGFLGGAIVGILSHATIIVQFNQQHQYKY
ncbi:unnamed protein product [Orchesella dallaii]|uniref:Gustatory receptor n=1 Tax=Orchesella dallaii TaxID=48710 RepID=A0ABP1PQ69_9HEXA